MMADKSKEVYVVISVFFLEIKPNQVESRLRR